MSSIPTKQIDGDVAVGRNVSAGGNVNIQGSTRVGHNLKVEGWLDAKNIKGANKGIFTTVEKLREAYPLPHDGWWAIVGKSLPGPIYVADGGDWVATGETGGNPTIDSEQYNEAVAELQGDMKSLQQDIADVEEKNKAQDTTLTTLGNSINSLQEQATKAQQTGDKGVADAAKVAAALEDLKKTKGEAGGIAPLDENGKVAAAYLPGSSDNVKDFHGFTEDVAVESTATEKNSTDYLCSILFNKTTSRFVAFFGQKYYAGWADDANFGERDANGVAPVGDKVYVDARSNKAYHRSGNTLAVIGSDIALGHTADTAFPGDEGKALQARADAQEAIVNGAMFVNVNAQIKSDEPFDSLTAALKAISPAVLRNTYGLVVTFLLAKQTNDGSTYKWVTYQRKDNAINGVSDYTDNSLWEEFGGGSAVGNCYNVTAARLANGNELPTSPATYDNKQSAIEYAIANGAAGIGVQITFAASAKGWRTFQYIGLSDDAESYANLDNWLDVAGQSAGEETILNINELCKELTGSSEYSLTSAVAALRKLCENKGIDYFKDGLIITYCVNAAEHIWETRQLLDKASAGNVEAWKDFGGGGGNDLTANDVPTDGGTDAFSTGGAYERMIVDFEESFGEDGNSKTYQAVNAKRKPIGSPITVPLGGGSGNTDATSFAVRFESQTIYGAAGGKTVGRFAARSVTKMGDEEVVNNITEISVSDANTGVLLKTEVLTNERSSVSLQDWKFAVDFTDWFDGAGQRSFVVQVKDQEGNVRKVDVSVNCVDITVVVEKKLSECRVPAEAGMTTLNGFYLFPRNTLGGSGGGIDAIVEILWDGEWRELGRANIQKTFSQDISINPTNVLGGGEKMRHGSYLLRIHGYAPQAKVTGNYVYTSIMCVDSAKATEPVVAIRYDAKTYNDALDGTVALYDTARMQVAAYTGASVSGNTEVQIKANGETIQTFNAASSATYDVKYQIQGYADGETIEFAAVGQWRDTGGRVHTGESRKINVVVDGSAIDVQLKSGATFGYDFALRTNADVDKTISDNNVTMAVTGANWRTNGFVNYLGQNALRIAENMQATIP